MELDKKIKDIYGCRYIESVEKLYPLQKWYNQLIDKIISEIDISDIPKMIRQNEFLDLAIKRALDFLKVNPLAGYMYEGEILEKLSEVDSCNLVPYSNELKNILLYALEECQKYEWICIEEKEDFEAIIRNITKRILQV